jgi:NTP pyrophosphatase (non-canonical NTP hydrolase)
MAVRQIQKEQEAWSNYNFGKSDPTHSLLGISEEVGELAHAHLKKLQGIRLTPEQYEVKAKDAIGDIVIYLMDYCTLNGWDFTQVVQDTWANVKTRNWKKFPKNGRTE